MKKIICLFTVIVLLMACSETENKPSEKSLELRINQLMDQWHKDAAEAKLESYLALMHEQSVYIGTDGTENWNKPEFRAFCEPPFAKGKAWDLPA